MTQSDEFVVGTCPAAHSSLEPCSRDDGHRGAHMTKQKVWSWKHEFFGTNETPATQTIRNESIDAS